MNILIKAIKSYLSNTTKVAISAALILLGTTGAIDSAKNTVVVSIDGKETKVVTFKDTFKDVLAENKIVLSPKDRVVPSIDSRVKKEDRIDIKKAVEVSVTVDGKELNIETPENTVEEMFIAEGLEVKDIDKVLPSRLVPIQEGLRVVIKRIEYRNISEAEPIEYSTVVKKDNKFEKGKTKVMQEGQQGERTIDTCIMYEDGIEVARNIVNETITKQPVSKVVAVGNMSPIRYSRGGSGIKSVAAMGNIAYKSTFKVQSTAYTAGYESTGKRPGDKGYGRTATGTIARRDPNGYSTVAVDRRVIPYGTKLYIEGYGFAIAEDTGGAIKGNKIDVFFNTVSECMQWGRRYVNIYILE
jgi:uncharacterized protein YabE (DUF348 family)